ncbi:MAG: SAM-dependent chlorinase/fluorinase [Betaproteobacteria bacterium]|nr:SAM-dependent chlorinase/fluorinase [Betaproteobacteria bacterium]
MIFLFTDFGAADIYVGQVKAVLAELAPEEAVIDLLHEAPAFNVKAAAHVLAALAEGVPREGVIMAVVDPGVGGGRDAVVVRAEGKYFVGPDNGLLSVVASRAARKTVWSIKWRPRKLARSFHGRDLFAPIAAAIASGAFPEGRLERKPRLKANFGAEDLPQVIYVDHYGNAMTGLRAGGLPRGGRLVVDGRWIARARVFSEVPPGEAFWYENSIGLAEIAANSASAAAKLGLTVGTAIGFSS